MPYIWNPTTKKSEWQNTWNGQDYGDEPTPPPQILPPGEHGKDPNYGGDPNLPDYIVDPANPVDAEGNGIAPAWDANQAATPPPATTPPAATGGSAYDQAKAQMDAVFAKYGRTPRPDEYAQWLGPSGYIMRDDINGAGQTLKAYGGGAIDPYWLSRMEMHASGDYWGNGTTPSDQNSIRAQQPATSTPSTETPFAPYTPSNISSSASTPAPYTPPTDADSQIAAEARQRILDLLRTPQTVDPQTLRDSPEMQAVYLQEQRAQERDRAALAERAAANGWSGSGGFEGGLNALSEKRGATEMQLMAQLAQQQMERNREDLKNGIEFALNQGQFDQASALKRELAALEAAIEREKISANLSMNATDDATRRLLGLGDLDLRRYLGNLGSSFDFANLEWTQRKDQLDRSEVPEI